MDASLRGKCREHAEAACAEDPSLRLAHGWYIDPFWGPQEHWWTVRPDGTIHDPTSSQFPVGGVTDWYEEYGASIRARTAAPTWPRLTLCRAAAVPRAVSGTWSACRCREHDKLTR